MGNDEKLAAAKAYIAQRNLSPVTSRKQKRAFEAAKVTRLTQSWRPSVVNINTDLIYGLTSLRARSRELYQNNDYAKKFAKMVVTNVVGAQGFTLQAKSEDGGKQDELANTAIEKAHADWAKKGTCETTGRLNFAEVCRTLMHSVPVDGEYLVRKVYGKAARNKYGFALQIIDPARLDATYNVNNGGVGNDIVMGIEIDQYRRPVAYHILARNPGETAARSRDRVPAEEIYHGFLTEHPEQIRGVPWMHASILSLHHLGEFEQSALIAARKGANTLGFFVSPDGMPPVPPSTADATGQEVSNDIEISVPGEYDTLPEGYDFKPYDSKYPDAMTDVFAKHYLRKISTGFGVTYNGLANDLEGVNYSSIRVGTIDERDNWTAIQAWFISSFLTEVYLDWLKAALLNSAITLPNGSTLPATKLDKFSAHHWQGRRWQWVDPLKDIQAAVSAIEAGLASPYQIAAQQGVDVEQVLDEIARFQALAAKKGVNLGNKQNSETLALSVSQET